MYYASPAEKSHKLCNGEDGLCQPKEVSTIVASHRMHISSRSTIKLRRRKLSGYGESSVTRLEYKRIEHTHTPCTSTITLHILLARCLKVKIAFSYYEDVQYRKCATPILNLLKEHRMEGNTA
jgi:hypothetical protein